MSKRQRLSNLAKQSARRVFVDLDDAVGSDAKIEYFPGWEEIDYPSFLEPEFDPVDAWWLAELCNLSYTPDSKEFSRVWNANKADRLEVLELKTPFNEILDVHKTGNSAAIYEINSGGTLLCFRGTSKLSQWISNLIFHPHEWQSYDPTGESTASPADGVKVHQGFYAAFNRIWPQLWPTLRLSPRPWIFAGHSLGGSLALFAHALAKADRVYTFGTPRTGNQPFVDRYLQDTTLIVNNQDIVSLVPARSETVMGEDNFTHGGEIIWLGENGEINQQPESILQQEPWDVLDDWINSSSNDLLKHRPKWLKDHFIYNYSEKLAKLID